MLDLAEGSKIHGSLSVPGMEFDKQYDMLSFNGTADEQLQEKIISMGETVETEKYLISCREGSAEQINDPETSLLCFKSEKIYGNIRISTRQTGDTLRQKNRGVTKSLKKLFSEARIPPSRRNNVVVLRDDVGVLGVLGFGEDDRAAAMPGESAVIIEIKDKFVED
ncbi:MAG: tRNA lysidine(34) synthetase TilS, partial [Anaerolineaceae bacterium]|nr:tRNA lysidine(34) synthetase TilS [Anaerolineaceae bacterium]